MGRRAARGRFQVPSLPGAGPLGSPPPSPHLGLHTLHRSGRQSPGARASEHSWAGAPCPLPPALPGSDRGSCPEQDSTRPGAGRPLGHLWTPALLEGRPAGPLRPGPEAYPWPESLVQPQQLGSPGASVYLLWRAGHRTPRSRVTARSGSLSPRRQAPGRPSETPSGFHYIGASDSGLHPGPRVPRGKPVPTLRLFQRRTPQPPPPRGPAGGPVSQEQEREEVMVTLLRVPGCGKCLARSGADEPRQEAGAGDTVGVQAPGRRDAHGSGATAAVIRAYPMRRDNTAVHYTPSLQTHHTQASHCLHQLTGPLPTTHEGLRPPCVPSTGTHGPMAGAQETPGATLSGRADGDVNRKLVAPRPRTR